MSIPESLKRTIGYGRCIRARELLGGNPIFNRAYDAHKAIFIHIPKTAGTSVGEALFPGVRSTHYRWEHYQSYSPERFENYFKFTFVRNPFDRVVSAYFYLQQGGKSTMPNDRRFWDLHLSPYKSFEDFVREGLHLSPVRRWGHFHPQAAFVASDDGTVQVDFVGRVENLTEDFQFVANKLMIDARLEHVNASQRKHYSEYYCPETVKIVRDLYAVDFDLFGYRDTPDMSIAS